MPITNREARIIKDIVNSYISPEDAKQMFSELVEEVANVTDNDSVKQSILMLNTLYAPKDQPGLFKMLEEKRKKEKDDEGVDK